MKKQLTVRQLDNRVYIRQIYLRDLKPILELAQITLHEAQEGKHTGVPRHYILVTDLFKFIECTRNDYIINIIQISFIPPITYNGFTQTVQETNRSSFAQVQLLWRDSESIRYMLFLLLYLTGRNGLAGSTPVTPSRWIKNPSNLEIYNHIFHRKGEKNNGKSKKSNTHYRVNRR